MFCGRFYPIVERQKQVCSVECDTSITVCNDCSFDTLCFDDGFSGRNSPDARLFRTSVAYGDGLSAVVCSVMGLSDMDNGVAVCHPPGRFSKAGYVVQPDYGCNQCGARLAVYLSFWLGGVMGAAFATSISIMVGGLVAMVYLLFYARHLRLQPLKWSVKSLRLSVRNIGYQWRIGSSALLGEATLAVLMFVGNQVFMSYLGDDGVGAFGIACYYIPFVFMVGNAIAQSAQPIISYNFGLGYKERVMTAERIALLTAVVCGVVATVAFTVYPYLLVGLFISLDSEAAKIAIHGFPYFASGFVFFIVNIAVVGYFQSVERIKPATIFALLRGFVFLIPSFILLPKFLGVSGIWLAMPLSEALTIIVILLFVLKHRYAYKVSSQLITS